MIKFDGPIQKIRLKGMGRSESLSWGCRSPRAVLYVRDDVQQQRPIMDDRAPVALPTGDFNYSNIGWGEQLESKP